MSLTNKTIAETYKDIVYIENSNTGFDSNIDQIKTGNGSGSSLYLSTNNVKIQPSADSTTNTVIYDVNGNALFTVDSTNDSVKSGIGQNHVNTQYAHFGIVYGDATQYTANTHFAVPFAGVNGGVNYTNDVDFGTGTAPDDYFTTTHTGVIIDIDYEMEYFQDYVYTVLCLDGTKRYFIESELIKL